MLPYKSLVSEFRNYSIYDKFFLIFFISGPWFLLIERSPADAWITLSGFIFLFYSIVLSKWEWVKTTFFISTALFVTSLLVTSLFSPLPQVAITETILWVRFPLFAMSVCFLFGNSIFKVKLMFMSMLLSSLTMTFILIHEMWVYPDRLRLEGPYGDLVPGMFMGKAMLPLAVFLLYLSLQENSVKKYLYATVPIVICLMTLLTGERMNFVVISTALLFITLLYKPSLKQIFGYFIFSTPILLITFWVKYETIIDRVFIQSSQHLSSFFDTYWNVIRPGLIAGLENPLTGIGTGTYRYLCDTLPEYSGIIYGYNECHTHNHQFYVQIFAEGGIISLLLAIMMILTIIKFCYQDDNKPKKNSRMNLWVIPFVLFIPQTNADFFGQWHNSFMWFSISITMAYSRFIYDD